MLELGQASFLNRLLDVFGVLLEALITQLLQALLLVDRYLLLVSSNIVKLFKFLRPVEVFLFHHLLVPFDIRVVLALFEDEFRTFLHGNLD